MSPCVLLGHKGHNNTIQVYSVTVMTYAIALEAGVNRCPRARLSGLQCFNMGNNGHGINLYGVIMTLMGN